MTSQHLLPDISANFDPSRLSLARQSKGLSKAALAERVGVSPAALGQYESGKIRPAPDTLAALAESLNVAPGFFAAGRPRVEMAGGTAHFRSLRRTRVSERQKALAHVTLTADLVRELEQVVAFPEPHVPVCTDAFEAGGNRAEMAAKEVRAAWCLDEGPIPHLVRLLEAQGVIVALPPFAGSGDIDAFSTVINDRPVVVLTGDRDDVFRYRFATAHELGHLVMHPTPMPGAPGHEKEADQFAASFLMPREAALDLLPRRLDLPRLTELQHEWGLSVEALLMRSQELGVLPLATCRRGFQIRARLRAQGLVQPEPIRSYSGELPVMTRRAADMAERYGLGLQDLSRRSGLPAERIEKLLGADPRPKLRLVEAS